MAISYRKLADSRTDFDKYLIKIGVNISHTDRIHIAYDIVDDMADLFEETEQAAHAELEKILYSKYSKGEPIQALLDICEIEQFLCYMDDIDESLLKEKTNLLLRGCLIREIESESNSTARNTQFELYLYSQLRLAGYKAELCKPRPDIKVLVGDRTYYIECKRILRLTRNSVNTNIKRGLKQLNEEMDAYDEGHFGVVAISVQRILSKPGEILNTFDPASGLKFIQDLSRAFIEDNRHSWQNPARLKNSRIASVWVHYSGGIVTEVQPSLSNLSNTTITNAWGDSRNLSIVVEDFKGMEAKLIEAKA